MSGDISLEPFFNNEVSEADGLKRVLRVSNPLNPIEGYQTSDMDMNPGSTSYYGFQNKEGAYYIMRAIVSGAVTNYTYSKGSSGYDAAWTARTTQTYNRFADEF